MGEEKYAFTFSFFLSDGVAKIFHLMAGKATEIIEGDDQFEDLLAAFTAVFTDDDFDCMVAFTAVDREFRIWAHSRARDGAVLR